VAPTRSRSIGRETARPSTQGPISDHMAKIYGIAIAGIVVAVALITLTSIGHTIALATQHFMLFYGGVLTLMALCASVAFGLVATDRMILNPGHRVFFQSTHRAISFGVLAFLIIHITTEILAQRITLLPSFIPFIEPFKTFYIGIGVIAGDLIILLVVTSIFRSRFTTNGKAWKWRAIHYSAYVSFLFGIWHGLLAGRPAKPYYDWTYGVIIALAILGVAVRALSNSLRPKENLSSPAVDERSTSSAPLRAAALSATAQYRGNRAAALGAGPATMTATAISTGPASGPMPTLAALPAAGVESDRQPFYEPGYDGPPRYVGASRPGTGPLAIPRADTGSMPRIPASGPMPRVSDSGPMPRPATGPMPRAAASRPATGPMPRANTGAMPRVPDSGPVPRAGGPRPGTGPMPRPGSRPGTGPMPRANTSAMPRVPDSGPAPRAGGPRPGTGPMPRPGSRPATGPMPRATTGAMPRVPDSGPAPRGGGPRPRRAPGRGQAPRNAPPPEQWSDERDGLGNEAGRGGGWE
jgi:DMSO/TMAO reductase YedYZ heme-binding membrane subunit